MNADIEKLINLAAEGGSISDRQREIIFRKAQEAGEDLDEVQFMMKIAAREAKENPISNKEQTISETQEKSIESIIVMNNEPEQLLKEEKNLYVAAILAFVLGWVGVHKFYLGNMKSGIIYLLFFWTLIPFFISIVEGFGYLLEAIGIKNK